MSVDVYQEVTDKILALLEQGTVPWKRPWVNPPDRHHNPISGTSYRGVNPLLLDLHAAASGYPDPRWVTFRQAKAGGAAVRKGEKGTHVIFWKLLNAPNAQDDQAQDDPRRPRPLLRYYTVFNVDQVDGLDLEPLEERPDIAPSTAVKELLDGYLHGPNPVTVNYGAQKACYVPGIDAVLMPDRNLFNSPEALWETLFHELVHSTGHESRLGRELEHPFGSPKYAIEELTAEVGAAMLCGIAGIAPQTISRSAAYIASWLHVLRNDRKLVVTAAARAQRAVDHIREPVAA